MLDPTHGQGTESRVIRPSSTQWHDYKRGTVVFLFTEKCPIKFLHDYVASKREHDKAAIFFLITFELNDRCSAIKDDLSATDWPESRVHKGELCETSTVNRGFELVAHFPDPFEHAGSNDGSLCSNKGLRAS